MKFSIIALLLLACATTGVLQADDKVQPLNVKTGLWEMTSVVNRAGSPTISPDVLARLTPEQRAQTEKRMRQGLGSPDARPTTRKDCVTKEQLEKASAFGESRKNCRRTVLSSTDRKLEMQIDCVEERGKTTSSFAMEAPSPETITGTIRMTSTATDRKMEITSTFHGRWLASSCTDVK